MGDTDFTPFKPTVSCAMEPVLFCPPPKLHQDKVISYCDLQQPALQKIDEFLYELGYRGPPTCLAHPLIGASLGAYPHQPAYLFAKGKYLVEMSIETMRKAFEAPTELGFVLVYNFNESSNNNHRAINELERRVLSRNINTGMCNLLKSVDSHYPCKAGNRLLTPASKSPSLGETLIAISMGPLFFFSLEVQLRLINKGLRTKLFKSEKILQGSILKSFREVFLIKEPLLEAKWGSATKRITGRGIVFSGALYYSGLFYECVYALVASKWDVSVAERGFELFLETEDRPVNLLLAHGMYFLFGNFFAANLVNMFPEIRGKIEAQDQAISPSIRSYVREYFKWRILENFDHNDPRNYENLDLSLNPFYSLPNGLLAAIGEPYVEALFNGKNTNDIAIGLHNYLAKLLDTDTLPAWLNAENLKFILEQSVRPYELKVFIEQAAFLAQTPFPDNQKLAMGMLDSYGLLDEDESINLILRRLIPTIPIIKGLDESQWVLAQRKKQASPEMLQLLAARADIRMMIASFF